MKRALAIATFLLLAITVYAAETRLSISPSDMKNGETKTLVDGDATITLKRSGDNLDVNIEGAGKTRHVVITRGDGTIVIDRDGVRRTIRIPDIEMPDVKIPDIEMPDVKIPPMPSLDLVPPQHPRAMRQTWFVCPKDHTILRVPSDKSDQTYKCPVDGTTMEKRKGRAFEFFFDEFPHDGGV